jgi:prevent-host-death family protein
MASIGVRELKSRLTYYLRRTKQGEDIIVTERGRPVAILQRLDVATARSRDANLARLADHGVVILPTRKPSRTWKLIAHRGRPVSDTVIEARERDRES